MVDKKELYLHSIHSLESIQSPEDRHQRSNMVFRKKQTRPLSAFEPQQQHSLLKQATNGQQQSMEWLPIMRRPYTLSTSSNCMARHSMSSFTLKFAKSASLYQPQLENYHHDNLSQKQIDRLSVRYSSSSTIQQLLQHTPSLASKLSSLSSSSAATTQSNDLCSEATMNDTNGPRVVKIAAQSHHQDTLLPVSPPISSPNSSVRLSTSSTTSFYTPRTSMISLPSSNAILPEEDFYYPSITHIQKNHGMRLRSFLCQSVLLDKTIRLEQHTIPSDPRFFRGNDEQTGQAKAILKLSMIKLSPKHMEHSVLAPFGIGFINSSRHLPGHNSGSGGSTGNRNRYASIPDSLVLEALNVWLSHSHLSHLSHASHIMRTGIKLYIVFDLSVIQ